MPALFTSPRFVALSSTNVLLPGAKLYFRQTGTSTPQNTYQDEALTVPHANPVVADGAGVFAPIYLDPSLPNYRVILADSSDVTQAGYPIDNVPSNQNTGQTFRLKSAAPALIFEETDAAADNKKWGVRANNGGMTLFLLNDAESVETDIARFTRSGTTAATVNFLATALQANGSLILANRYTAKASSTTRTSTTTLTADPDLSLTVPIAGLYRMELWLSIVGLVTGTQGFKFQLVPTNGSASSPIFGTGVQNVNGTTAIGTFGSSLSLQTFTDISTTENYIYRNELMSLTPSGGMTLALHWAQEASDANGTRLISGSAMTLTRVNS